MHLKGLLRTQEPRATFQKLQNLAARIMLSAPYDSSATDLFCRTSLVKYKESEAFC